MSINNRICLIIEHFGGSITKFSERSGINYRSVQNYMRGEREPNSDAYLKFAQIGVNINWLLTGDGEMFVENNSQLVVRGPREAALLDNYRAAPEDGKRALEMSALAFAAGMPQPHKPAKTDKKAAGGLSIKGDGNIQIGGNLSTK